MNRQAAVWTILINMAIVMNSAHAADQPMLTISWPPPEAAITVGDDQEKAVGVVVKSNFTLKPAGQCGAETNCGHIHMKIDPQDDSCNIPGKPYNSMNSDTGGELIKAQFGYCKMVKGKHVIGVLLADDHHRPVIWNGKPVTALVPVVVQ